MTVPITNIKMSDIASEVDGETSLLKPVSGYFKSPNIIASGLDPTYCSGADAYSRLANLRTSPFEIGKFRNYNKNAVTYTWRSGLFYTWQAASTVHLPSGWHVATQDDWIQIFSAIDSNFLYEVSEISSHFKSGLTILQNTFSGWGDRKGENLTGFNSHAVGWKFATTENSYWVFIKRDARFWSADINFGENGSFKYFIQFTATSWKVEQGISSWYIPEPETGTSYDMFNIRLVKDDDINTGSVTDYHGNVYPTVKIGDKVVTAENLRTSVDIYGNAFTDLRGGDILAGAFVDSIAMDYDQP